MRVERRLMSSTVPTRSPKRQTSPTWMTSSASREMPPKRFSRLFWAAKATAIPPIPSPARAVVMLKPRVLSIRKMREDENQRFQDALTQKHDRARAGSSGVDGALANSFAPSAEESATAAN